MNKRIVSAKMPIRDELYRVHVLFENELPIEIDAQREKARSLLGNIYLGIVEKVAPGIHAAFVRIDKNLTCYLPLDSKCPTLQTGEELLVQISREAQKTKLPTVTTELSLSGTFLVLHTGKQKTAYSSRLTETEKTRLEKIANTWLNSNSGTPSENSFGMIFRTSSKEAQKEDLEKEYLTLHQQLTELLRYGKMRTPGTCLYQAEKAVPDMMKRYGTEISEYLTDIDEEYCSCEKYLCEHPFTQCNLIRYQDPMIPLYKQQSFDKLLRESQCEKVELPSGGFLVIQPTEAFVSVDVNSGKQLSGKNAKKFYYEVNLEAAREIARQIRLRGLSGLILIDFINMEDPLQEKLLLSQLQSYVRADPVPTRVIDMTVMHIAEVTRQKKKKSLSEQIGGTEDAAWRE
ncbi:MAG: ribonuclease E/G [Fusicatenibacter sp.]|nr:ribonuclease E/G [Lachnospiraceae bacterium]MDY2938573.1 ribonuclease E/G [Fusicatenibacter sp.]